MRNESISVVFDVGANCGGFLRAALDGFPNARLFSFEPHPRTYQRLQEGVRDSRASLAQIALGEARGLVPFYEYGTEGDGSLMNSMVPDARFAVRGRYPAKVIDVPCSTIDAFVVERQIDRVDLLKVDVEGCELSVLKGARAMFEAGRIGYVYCEFNDVRPRAGTSGGALLPLSDFLDGYGFRYVATYTDFVLLDDDMFVCANVLFARHAAWPRRGQEL